MRPRTYLTPATIARAMRDFTAGTLPVRASWVSVCQRPGTIRLHVAPVFHVNADSRPDVADLVRVHDVEGDGDLHAAWSLLLPPGRGYRAMARLDVAFYRPVSCEFALLVDVERHREALGVAAATGYVSLTFQRRRIGSDGQPVRGTSLLTIGAAGYELAEMLNILRVVEGQAA